VIKPGFMAFSCSLHGHDPLAAAKACALPAHCGNVFV
jgi:hypothetical protein